MGVDTLLKPADGERDAEEDVRASCSSWGFVLVLYVPGNRSMVSEPELVREVPTVNFRG